MLQLILAGLLASATESRAWDVTFGGNARVAEEYNTNIFLTARPHDYAWGQGIDGGWDLLVAGERWGTRLNADFANRWYVPDNNLDYFNQLFSSKNYFLTERSRFGLDARYHLDTALASVDDVTQNLGFVARRVPRTVRVLSPSWLYTLTEKTQMTLGYTYQDTVYEQKDTAQNFPDSVAHIGSLGLTHQWNDRLQLTSSASYTDYSLTSSDQSVKLTNIRVPTVFGLVCCFPGIITQPGITSSIRTASLMAGLDYQFTDTFDLALSAGGQYNETARPAYNIETVPLFQGAVIQSYDQAIEKTSSSTLSEIVAAKASKRFENSDLSLAYDRTLSPNIQGDLITYDNVSLNGTHRFTPHLSTRLSLTFSDRTFPISPGLANSSNRLFGAWSSINWQLAENWLLSGSYQFYYLDFYDLKVNNIANSHALYLNIQYLFDQQKL